MANVVNVRKILIVDLTNLVWQVVSAEPVLIMNIVKETILVWRMENVVNAKWILTADLMNLV